MISDKNISFNMFNSLELNGKRKVLIISFFGSLIEAFQLFENDYNKKIYARQKYFVRHVQFTGIECKKKSTVTNEL